MDGSIGNISNLVDVLQKQHDFLLLTAALAGLRPPTPASRGLQSITTLEDMEPGPLSQRQLVLLHNATLDDLLDAWSACNTWHKTKEGEHGSQ